MITDFNKWMEQKLQTENLGSFMPNMGQKAIPMNNPQSQQTQPQKVSLSTFASKVRDPNWIQLYDKFTQVFARQPNDPNVSSLGQALYQAATTNNFNGLQPFVQKISKSLKNLIFTFTFSYYHPPAMRPSCMVGIFPFTTC